jgi:hypothetical protein
MDIRKGGGRRLAFSGCGVTSSFRCGKLEALVGPCWLGPDHDGAHEGGAKWFLESGDRALSLSGRPTAARWSGTSEGREPAWRSEDRGLGG